MFIFEVRHVTDELLTAFEHLVPQLSSANPAPTRQALTELIESPVSTVLAARHSSEAGPIVGALCLVVYRVPTGLRAVIEDVIVDGAARGQGIGEALMRRAIELARKAGAATIALTSNPRREAANRLYVRLGFVLRDTNSYLLKL